MPYLGEFYGLTTRQMTETVRLFPTKEYVGRQLFSGPQPVAAKTAAWDVVEGARTLAPFGVKATEAHIQKLKKRKRITSELLHINEKKAIDEATRHFVERIGEFDEPYGEQMLTDELADLVRTVENTKEWARWYAMTRGKLDIVQEDPALQISIDYGFTASHLPEKTGTGRWTDQANSTPLSDLLTWRRLISRDSWLTPGKAFLTSVGMQHLVENDNIQTLLQYTIGNQIGAEGVITRLAGIDLTVYDVNYVDSAAVVQQFIPDDMLVMVAREPIGREFMGQVDVKDGEAVRTQMGLSSYSFSTDDPVDIWMVVKDAWLPAIQIPDGIVAARIY